MRRVHEPSMTDTQELVVPRSMPITGPVMGVSEAKRRPSAAAGAIFDAVGRDARRKAAI